MQEMCARVEGRVQLGAARITTCSGTCSAHLSSEAAKKCSKSRPTPQNTQSVAWRGALGIH